MLKVAIPNKGALSEGAVEILATAGYRCRRYGRELSILDREHDIEFLYLRPRDIAVYAANGVVDAGITGRDLSEDSQANIVEVLPLGFGKSRFCYAAPKGAGITPAKMQGLRVATSYPNIVTNDLAKIGVKANIVKLDGAVEISIQLGVADAIADVVDSGRTLMEAGLEIIGEPVMYSEAVLVAAPGKADNALIAQLVRRVQGILVAREYCLLEYVAPKARLDEVCSITPGVKSPTLSPVHDSDWMAVAAMVKRKELNKVIDRLSELGAHGIIAHDIKTCRL
ncbi:MAG: ATP phosphoribosyltransferase [Opitutales bacterium]|nr:ATP phosphoribosyltransferase [Opitutales bacterium]